MTQHSVEELRTIDPRYANRIKIWQDVTEIGGNLYRILHQRSYFHKPTDKDIPKEYRIRKSFKGAEAVALHLLLNYTKYF